MFATDFLQALLGCVGVTQLLNSDNTSHSTAVLGPLDDFCSALTWQRASITMDRAETEQRSQSDFEQANW